MSEQKPLQLKDSYDYLIIGADAAGNSAVGQIRRNDKQGTIGVLEKGNIIAYGACGLPYAISGQVKSFEKLVHFTPEGFGAKTGAEILTGHEALSVNTKDHSVLVRALSSGTQKQVSYKKLMVGTGAEPIRLPFIDYTSPRVFELKSVPDGQAIQNFISQHQPKRAAIIGSGYIGMESAETFREMGLDVDIYEALDRPVPRMPLLISEGITPLLEKHGITFFANAKVTSVQTDSTGIDITTDQGTKRYDMLLSAIGVRPATKFLEGSDITLDRGAVVVDRYGKTSAPDVWSGGDCAVVYHKILDKNIYLPLGHTANKQGRIAGINMSGGSLPLPGVVGTVIFKFFEGAFAHTGLSLDEARAAGYDATTSLAQRPSKAGYYPGSGKARMQLISDQKDGRLLGATLVGPLDSFGMIDAAAVMVYQGMNVDEIAWFDFAYAPPFAPVWNALISAAGKSE